MYLGQQFSDFRACRRARVKTPTFYAARDRGASAAYGWIGLFGKPKALKKIQRRFKLKQECVFVGDEVRDIDAARLAGTKCIAVTWGFNTSLKKHGPDAIAYTPPELLQAIKALCGD